MLYRFKYDDLCYCTAERLFSCARNVVTKTSTSLSPEHVKLLVFSRSTWQVAQEHGVPIETATASREKFVSTAREAAVHGLSSSFVVESICTVYIGVGFCGSTMMAHGKGGLLWTGLLLTTSGVFCFFLSRLLRRYLVNLQFAVFRPPKRVGRWLVRRMREMEK
ncbi:unnamed protein product [Sphacelaria rigidula]